MTTEHKILLLIDRGVTSLVDLGAIFDGRRLEHDALMQLIFCSSLNLIGPSRDVLELTGAGLNRLNELDESKS